jgi:hypothetical protein
MNLEDNQLLKDLDRLAGRVNSEEGVPMFLACEDLAPHESARKSETVTSTSLNDDFVSMFRRDVTAVQLARPDAPLTSIAKIVERLAEKDFGIAPPEPRS